MKRKSNDGGHAVIIEYKSLGIVTVAEFAQALWEDIQALKDFYGVSYLKDGRLIVPATNEYGDTVVIKHPERGHVVRRFDTHHYRPACLDYQL